MTTKERVKLRLNFSETAFDGLIDLFIGECTSMLEGILGYNLSKTTVVETRNWKHNELFLFQKPVISVTQIEENYGTQATPSWQVLDANNYTVDTTAGMIYSVYALKGMQLTRITYEAGYDAQFEANNIDVASANTMPLALIGLCENLVVRMFNKRRSEGKTNESVADSSTDWGDVITKEDKMVIDRYKVHAI